MAKRVLKKDVTDAEIASFMAASPAARALLCLVRQRNPEENTSKTKSTTAKPKSSRPLDERSRQHSNPKSDLTDDESTYALSVHKQRNLTMTGRRDALGWSTDRAGKVCRALVEKKFVAPFTVNLGRAMGGTVRLLELTETGAEALGVKRKYPRRGRVGAEHWFWQVELCRHFHRQGFEASIEKELNGKFADVGVFQDGCWQAYEVAISPNNEVRNVQKDLEAGFDRVVICCRDVPVKKAVTARVNEHLSAGQLEKTDIVLLSDFSFVKQLFSKSKVGRRSPQSE